MIITKTITHRYEVIDVSAKPFMKFGVFRETREKYRMKVERTCFCCNRKFKDDDDIYLVMLKGTLNRLFCKSCNDKALNDLKKGGLQ